mmetsp:Transcript_7424/g.11168  ORF Transcript_7424/g.11168 Transcript_7424/m.11168 type:complete len:105 (+) Transcript_7424:101-415(+)
MSKARRVVESFIKRKKYIKAYFRLARTQIALHLYTDATSNLETALMQVVQQQQEQEEYPKEAMTEEEIQTECSDRPRGVAHTIYNKKVIHHTHAHTHTRIQAIK